MSKPSHSTPVVFIPALLCDEQLYREVIAALPEAIEPHVLLSPKPRLEDSVADILSRAPSRSSERPTVATLPWKSRWRRRSG